MKSLHKVSAVFVLTLAVVFALAGPGSVLAIAATAPSLGTASTFSVLGVTLTADGSGATISGDLGATTKTGTWTHTGGIDYIAGAAAGALSDATSAWTSMGSGGGTAWDPVTDINPAPGLWTRSGDATFSGTLTLNGSASDVWIFQINNSLTFTGTVNLTGGAQACNVYWRIASDATINSGGAGSKFVGTLIANGNVSTVGGVHVDGRLVSNTGTLSTAGVTNIDGPSCAAAPIPGAGTASAYANVVKVVVNDNGGTKTVYDFPLFVNGSPVTSGIAGTYTPVAGTTYTVTETSNPNYTRTFSGDCNANGQFTLAPGDNKYCIVTNNDIGAPVAVPVVPPLIDVVKVPNPLALPAGPGPVTYTYTLRNVGTVPVTDITMVGDTCSPIVRVSGDTNGDNKLDVNETWTYTCSTNLTQTHTNIVTATGWANGISAVDVANATVIVGAPIVPPLIHVTKVPSPLTLGVGGGMETYTNQVTNPGTVALSNVRLSDNTCSSVTYVSGDSNGDSMLQPGETWTYTCRVNVSKTTTNTVIASGDANGMTARDLAVATVVVATAGLPASGVAPIGNYLPWLLSLVALSAVSAAFFLVRRAVRTA